MSRLFHAGLALVSIGVVAATAAEPPAEPPRPEPFAWRVGEEKRALLRDGGNAESEAAVARGLAWLAGRQKADGSWEFDTATQKDNTVAATGMALLPFLGAGENPNPSTKGRPASKYQAAVSKGLEYLRSRQDKDGFFRNAEPSPSLMYVQAIASLAVIEAYGLTSNPALKPSAQKAVDAIQSAQAEDGSWGYTPNLAGDTSILGWQVQALHAAKLCRDLVVSDAVLKRANVFLDSVAGGTLKETYGYRSGPGSSGTSLTAVGLLCRYTTAGWGPYNPGLITGVKGLLARPPRKAFFETYYYYYATQVVHFFEGKSWKAWNEGDSPAGPGMRNILIGLQVTKGDPTLVGSWPRDHGAIGKECGSLGSTCLSLLTLEVYYRYPKLYRRAAAEGELKELDRATEGTK